MPTTFESVRKYASAAAPPIASVDEPSCGSCSSAATRRLGTRKLRSAAFTTIGREIASRALSAGAASISAVTFGGVTVTGSSVAPGVRSSCPSERTMTSAAASRSRRAPVSCGDDLDAQPVTDELRALRRHIDVVGDLVERVLERGVRDGESREHLGSEDAGAEAPEAAQRAETVSGATRRGDRGGPVRLDGQLIRGEAVRLSGRDERDGLGRALLEEAVQLRDRLAAGQPADVDAGDLRPGGELAPRAGERQTRRGSRGRRRSRRRGRASAAPRRRADDGGLAVNREANRRARNGAF